MRARTARITASSRWGAREGQIAANDSAIERPFVGANLRNTIDKAKQHFRRHLDIIVVPDFRFRQLAVARPEWAVGRLVVLAGVRLPGEHIVLDGQPLNIGDIVDGVFHEELARVERQNIALELGDIRGALVFEIAGEYREYIPTPPMATNLDRLSSIDIVVVSCG